MAILEPIKPRVRLLAAAELWAAATGRTLGALSSLVTNQGSTLARLNDPANAVTDATLERFARFLVEPGNWGGADVPAEVIAFGHAVGVTAQVAALSAGKHGENSPGECAA